MTRGALIGSLALALAPAAAFADMSYTNVDLKYLNLSLDNVVHVDGDGFAIAGSYELGKKMFLLGEWQEQSYDGGVDGRQFEVGAGLHHPINSTLDFVGTLSYLDSKVDVGPFNVSDDGFGLGAGIRTVSARTSSSTHRSSTSTSTRVAAIRGCLPTAVGTSRNRWP